MDISELNWSAQIWKEINADVLKEVGKVRVAQKVLPTSTLENDLASIPNEVIDFTNMTVAEVDTKRLVKIYREFSLTSTQAKNEGEQRVCRTLARMAAKEIALGEDAYFFQVSDRATKRGQGGVVPVLNNAAIRANNWQPNLNFDLLGEANDPGSDDGNPAKPSKTIQVDSWRPRGQRSRRRSRPVPGSHPQPALRREDVQGRHGRHLETRRQGASAGVRALPAHYRLRRHVRSPSTASLVTTADRIKPLVEGGFAAAACCRRMRDFSSRWVGSL